MQPAQNLWSHNAFEKLCALVAASQALSLPIFSIMSHSQKEVQFGLYCAVYVQLRYKAPGFQYPEEISNQTECISATRSI